MAPILSWACGRKTCRYRCEVRGTRYRAWMPKSNPSSISALIRLSRPCLAPRTSHLAPCWCGSRAMPVSRRAIPFASDGTRIESITSTYKRGGGRDEESLAGSRGGAGRGVVRRGGAGDHLLLPDRGRRPDHEDRRPDGRGLREGESRHQGAARVHGDLPGGDRA